VKARRGLSFSNSGADEGQPVRDEAKDIFELIRNDDALQRRREEEKAMRADIASKEIPPPSRRHSRGGSFGRSGSFGSQSGSGLIVGAKFGLNGEENGGLLGENVGGGRKSR